MSDYKSATEAQEIWPKKRGGKNKLFLIISGGVLLVALAVSAVLLLSNGPAEDSAQRVVEFGTVMKGVTVGGIDISGMTRDEALAATAGLQDKLLGEVNFDIDINGEIKTFTAQDFALYTDYETVIEQAIAYGRTGSFDERLAAAKEAKEAGKDFPVDVIYDETALKTALSTLKSEMDTPPIDATATFAAWGFTKTEAADGTVTYTPYTPDLDEMKEICKAYANGKEYTGFPDRVRVTAEEDKPLKLRYEYWNDRTGGYVDGYVPRDADIAHFIYTEEVDGLVVDTDAIYDAVVSQVESDTYETIVAPVQVTPATVKLETIKAQTQMIASWTSSYGGASHYGYNRNYNVAMLSSLLNGGEIKPGDTFSVNTTAGPRNATTAKTYGWREAAGIENGGYSPQYGGGVCQLGSTTFNAAIRSGLTVTEHWHHTIPSDYVPIGLDATLDSGGKDLKLKNDTQMTYYLVSYINPTDRNVTVEFYGVPLTDANGQPILLTYTSKKLGRYGTPTSKVVEVDSGFAAPDGTVINETLPSYEYAKNREGTTAQSYIITRSLDGTKISEEKYDYWKYPVINGTTYVLKVVTPTPGPSESTSPPPSESPVG